MAGRAAGTSTRAVARRARTGITFEDMAARRAERLVNLVICLLSTRQFISAERIRDAVPGYEASDGSPSTDEAFKRMFERDKAELRDLGIPLETGRNSAFDPDEGYRISRRDYELPPIEFDAAEAAAIGLAARLWQSATLGEPARAALMKLRAAGTDVQAGATPGAVPAIDASDPSLPTLLEAARLSRPVGFAYQKSGSGSAERRTLEPWGVLSWRRRWYVAGFDRDRGAARSFRLSRIVGKVEFAGRPASFARPDSVDLVKLVAGRSPDDTRVARIRVSGAGAGQLRRLAGSELDGVLTVNFSDRAWLARIVTSAGTSATVLEPPDLVAAVRERLSAVAGVHE
ncbi:MAG: proteasome accessory factor [Pseudonocardiales bacterium]|nr:proteasome accessory factor [Pseudonocardiales bacterium]